MIAVLKPVFGAVGLLLLTAIGPVETEARADPSSVDRIPVHVFWRVGCPHCERARAAWRDIAGRRDDVVIEEIELGTSQGGDALFVKLLALFEIARPAVPFAVIGEHHVVGFSAGGATEDAYLRLVERCATDGCVDVVADLRQLSDLATGRLAAPPIPDEAPVAETDAVPSAVTLPLIGEFTLAGLSLPALTIVLAGIDGFNPCAMWVLVLLIGLLLGVHQARRVWVLGITFLAVTGAMYFAIMAAWLNVVLWLGAAQWLRVAIGALAVGAGLHYLREYWTGQAGVCRVTSPGSRRWFTDAFRRVVGQPSLLIASLGIAALAVAVNVVELLCSAGIPAVYTQVLAMHELSPAAHYGYLALYLAVFLLDDAVILLTALVALRAATVTGGYARISHVVGGGVLLALGSVMILRPEWLG